MPTAINPFDNNALTLISMTESAALAPYAESTIERMGIFDEEGITQTRLGMTEQDGVLTIVPNQKRGGQAAAHKHTQGKIHYFDSIHLPVEDAITADDIQGKATPQDPTGALILLNEVNKRIRQIKQSLMVTVEHLRIGALKGSVVDADGETVIEDLFTRFSITQKEIDFVLGTASTVIRKKVALVVAHIENILGGLGYDHIEALCSPEFFRDFTTHALVEKAFNTYGASAQGQFLRDDLRGGFVFGGVTWREYRGYSSPKFPFIPAGDCRFFPVGVMGLHQTKWCPSTFLDDVNAVGIPITMKQIVNPENTAMKILAQSSPIVLTSRPGVLVRGYTSN